MEYDETFSPTPDDRHDMPPGPPPKRRGASCFLVGCLTVLVVMVIGAVVVFFVVRSLMLRWVEEYTDTELRPLPVSTMAREEVDQLFARIEAFEGALKSGVPAPPLELSADDINALIQYHPDWEPMRGKVHVTIKGQAIRGEFSVPIDLFVKGRYLNGTAGFNVFLANGVLFVFTESIEVAGKTVPDFIMQEFRRENLAKDAQGDPELASIIERLESTHVENGIVSIVPKVAIESLESPDHEDAENGLQQVAL
jgi:hypothetical protein